MQVERILYAVHAQYSTGDSYAGSGVSYGDRTLVDLDLAFFTLDAQANFICAERTEIVFCRQVHAYGVVLVACLYDNDTEVACIAIIQHEVGSGDSLEALCGRSREGERYMIYITIFCQYISLKRDRTVVLSNFAVSAYSLEIIHVGVLEVHVVLKVGTGRSTLCTWESERNVIVLVLCTQLAQTIVVDRLVSIGRENNVNGVTRDDERSLIISQGVVVTQRVGESSSNMNQLLLLVHRNRLGQRSRSIRHLATFSIHVGKVREHVSQRVGLVERKLLRSFCYYDVEVVNVLVSVVQLYPYVVVGRVEFLRIVRDRHVVVVVLCLRSLESDSCTLCFLQTRCRKGLMSLYSLHSLHSLCLFALTQHLCRSCTCAKSDCDSAYEREKFLHNSFVFVNK